MLPSVVPSHGIGGSKAQIWLKPHALQSYKHRESLPLLPLGDEDRRTIKGIIVHLL